MRYAAALLVAVGVLCLAYAARAERPTAQFVLWDESSDRPWVTAKGHQATATSATACSLASVEAARSAPSGTRFSCRRIAK